MADAASRETDRMRSELILWLNLLYDDAEIIIKKMVRLYLAAIYLKGEAGPNNRLRHARRNGLNAVIAIVVYYILEANTQAVRHINSTMNNIIQTNYDYIIVKAKKEIGLDLETTPSVDTASKYSKRTFRRAESEARIDKETSKEIKRGVRDGDNSDELIERMKRVVNKSRTSAVKTARTEITRTRSLSRINAMRDTAKHGVKWKKTWRHSDYVNAPREWHEDLNDVTIDINESFLVDGVEMDAPGDPRGGAKNNANCHCYLDGEIVRE